MGDGVVPRLAIACYHRPDDLVAIPDFMAGLGVELPLVSAVLDDD